MPSCGVPVELTCRNELEHRVGHQIVERPPVKHTGSQISARHLEPRRLDALLRQSESRYRYLVENSPDLVWSIDEHGRFKGQRWIDVPFEKRNTGFEGLVAVRWKGKDYLLALCEGNRCRSGSKGRQGGGGRIHVLERGRTTWRPIALIKLPKTVDFADYSAVALRGDRIAVISQMSSRLWIGRLRRGTWTVAGQGRIYDFPRTKKGKIRYCTLEGLYWLSETTFVLVSDLSKRHYRTGCGKKDQSIHVFALPRSRT